MLWLVGWLSAVSVRGFGSKDDRGRGVLLHRRHDARTPEESERKETPRTAETAALTVYCWFVRLLTYMNKSEPPYEGVSAR
jgi:hypothetical protein